MQQALGGAKVVVHGGLPEGGRLEFLAPGSPDRLTAQAGEKGAYSIELVPGRYEVTFFTASRRVSTTLTFKENVELNGLPPETGKSDNSSAQQYDLLADWRVADKSKRGVAGKVSLEAELLSGRTEKLTVWALSGTGDEEKETTAPLDITPDGRVLFRVRESHLRPDRVVALRLRVEAAGHAVLERRLQPVLEFAASGHFHAVYPEQYEMILP